MQNSAWTHDGGASLRFNHMQPPEALYVLAISCARQTHIYSSACGAVLHSAVFDYMAALQELQSCKTAVVHCNQHSTLEAYLAVTPALLVAQCQAVV
jgi:hypothetical protein